jgi:glycine/D-amino acid oxidase-like deaminating enzyme
MQSSYDVVIIGGGVIGSSVAYHLSANPDFTGRIAVIERDPGYTVASSSLSTSAIRHAAEYPHVQLQHRILAQCPLTAQRRRA